MKIKSYKSFFACPVMVALIMLNLSIPSFAQSSLPAVEKSISIYVESGTDYSDKVEELLDEGYTSVDVLFTDLEEETLSQVNLEQEQSTKKSVGPVRTYYVKNVRKGSDYIGNYRLASADGPPRVTLSISETKSVSTTVSGTFGASNSTISAAVGWSVTGSSSVTVSGSYKVPTKIGNKYVKRGYLDAYPKFKTKLYDVYYGIQGTSSEVKKGTGTTRKAIGVSFKKRHTYK